MFLLKLRLRLFLYRPWGSEWI